MSGKVLIIFFRNNIYKRIGFDILLYRFYIRVIRHIVPLTVYAEPVITLPLPMFLVSADRNPLSRVSDFRPVILERTSKSILGLNNNIAFGICKSNLSILVLYTEQSFPNRIRSVVMVENLKQLLPFIIDTNNPLVQNKTNVTDGIAATIYIFTEWNYCILPCIQIADRYSGFQSLLLCMCCQDRIMESDEGFFGSHHIFPIHQ